jgi:signal transduction histidine kinase
VWLRKSEAGVDEVGSRAVFDRVLEHVLAQLPPTYTDEQVAGPLCAAAAAFVGGSCTLLRRDRDGAVLTLGASAGEAARAGDALGALAERLARVGTAAGAIGEPVILAEPPWLGDGVAIPVAGIGGVRWLLVLADLRQSRDDPAAADADAVRQVAWAARHLLGVGGAVAQIEATRALGDAAAHRLIAVSRLVDMLPATLDLESTVDAVLDAVVPYVGDWAVLLLGSGASDLERVGSRHNWLPEEATLEQVTQFPLPGDVRVRNAWLASGEPFLVGPEEAEGVRRWPISAHDADLVAALAPRSAIVAPLRRGPELVAVLVVGTSRSGQSYGREDLRLLRDLGKQARLAIQAAQLFAGAERARRAREDLLAIVSHDLRNPLHTVRLAGAVLGFPDLPAEKRAQQSAALERSLESMDRLIQDLLDAARIEAGNLPLHPTSLAVPGLLMDAYKSFELIAGGKNIQLRIDAGAPSVLVRADRDAVLRVFGNLLGNAVSFTPPGGRITLGAESLPGEVAFYVRDTGPGIDPAILPHIFDRYWQANRASRSGAGLGLAIAKGIVEGHGGRIGARTLAEGGSELRFTLPGLSAADTPPI